MGLSFDLRTKSYRNVVTLPGRSSWISILGLEETLQDVEWRWCLWPWPKEKHKQINQMPVTASRGCSRFYSSDGLGGFLDLNWAFCICRNQHSFSKVENVCVLTPKRYMFVPGLCESYVKHSSYTHTDGKAKTNQFGDNKQLKSLASCSARVCGSDPNPHFVILPWLVREQRF